MLFIPQILVSGMCFKKGHFLTIYFLSCQHYLLSTIYTHWALIAKQEAPISPSSKMDLKKQLKTILFEKYHS